MFDAILSKFEKPLSMVIAIDDYEKQIHFYSISEEDILSSNDITSLLIKPDSVLNLDKLCLSKNDSVELYNGRPFLINEKDGNYLVYDDFDNFVGVGIVSDKRLKIKAYIKD